MIRTIRRVGSPSSISPKLNTASNLPGRSVRQHNNLWTARSGITRTSSCRKAFYTSDAIYLGRQHVPVLWKQRPFNGATGALLRLVLEANGNGSATTTDDDDDDGVNDTLTEILACSGSDLHANVALYYYSKITSTLRRGYHFLHSLVHLLWRGTQIGLRLSPLLVLTPLAVVESWCAATPTSTPRCYVESLTWRYLLHSLRSLGPAFVKLAQWTATRRDLFAPYVCDGLGGMHDDAHPGVDDRDATHRTLLADFGPDYAERLRLSGPVLGSGAAARVYQAYLKGHGLVAVKVLHPHVRRSMQRDFKLITACANTLDGLLPHDLALSLSLPRAADNFGKSLNKQVDLTIEADNLRRFRDNFGLDLDKKKNGKNHHVDFPNPIPEWTSPNVLVESLVTNARPISAFLSDTSEQGARARAKLSKPFLKAFMKMIFVDNFVHCDLHPGNVLVQTNTNDDDDDEYTIVFLDAGISTSLTPHDLLNFKDLFRAVVVNDGERVGRLMVERARHERCSDTPGGVDRFARGVAALVDEFHHDSSGQGTGGTATYGLSLGVVRIGSLLKRVLDLCRTHGVEIDPAMANVVISILVLEGLGRSLDPDVDLIRTAVPFLMGLG